MKDARRCGHEVQMRSLPRRLRGGRSNGSRDLKSRKKLFDKLLQLDGKCKLTTMPSKSFLSLRPRASKPDSKHLDSFTRSLFYVLFSLTRTTAFSATQILCHFVQMPGLSYQATKMRQPMVFEKTHQLRQELHNICSFWLQLLMVGTYGQLTSSQPF